MRAPLFSRPLGISKLQAPTFPSAVPRGWRQKESPGGLLAPAFLGAFSAHAPLHPLGRTFPHALRGAGLTRRHIWRPHPRPSDARSVPPAAPPFPVPKPASLVERLPLRLLCKLSFLSRLLFFFLFHSLPSPPQPPPRSSAGQKEKKAPNKHPAGNSFNSLAPRTRQPPRAPMAELTRDWREEGGRWRVGRCWREGGCRGRGWGDPGACRFLKGAQRPAQPEKPGCTRAVCVVYRERGKEREALLPFIYYYYSFA